MKQKGYLLLPLLILSGCIFKSDLSPEKPVSLALRNVEIRDLLPAMKERPLYLTLKAEDGKEILGVKTKLRDAATYNAFDTSRIKADQEITIAALKERGGSVVASQKVNPAQKITNRDGKNEYRLYNVKMEGVKMTAILTVKLIYY